MPRHELPSFAPLFCVGVSTIKDLEVRLVPRGPALEVGEIAEEAGAAGLFDLFWL